MAGHAAATDQLSELATDTEQRMPPRSGSGIELARYLGVETTVGQAFIQRMPGRFDSIDLGPELGETGPALLFPLRATDTPAGALVALRSKDDM